jgi:hypothetical protein
LPAFSTLGYFINIIGEGFIIYMKNIPNANDKSKGKNFTFANRFILPTHIEVILTA